MLDAHSFAYAQTAIAMTERLKATFASYPYAISFDGCVLCARQHLIESDDAMSMH